MRKLSDSIVDVWREYLKNADWESLIANKEPIETGCGPVYELPNPIERPGEGFAIVDMRNLSVTEPHYHPVGTEIIIVLQGRGVYYIGTERYALETGDAAIIPPNTAHYGVPEDNFVVAAINTPPYRPEDYVVLTESNFTVKFDIDNYNKTRNSTH